jgi:hypothetical protein
MLFWLTSRNLLLFISTGFSILLVMMLLNIVTVTNLVSFGLPENIACYAEKLLAESRQFSDVLVQLFDKLFTWAGIDTDLSKVGIVNEDHASYCSSDSESSNNSSGEVK